VVLNAKLRRLAGWNAARRVAADRYTSLLDGVEGVRTPEVLDGNEHVWHLYVIEVAPERRDGVVAALNAAGVGAGIHYPTPLHLTPAFAHLGHPAGDFPVAERLAGRILSLPIFPGITERQQDRVVEQLLLALGR
jgi:dTDP-4-amino-4,6-dideoxygalactose transaminase